MLNAQECNQIPNNMNNLCWGKEEHLCRSTHRAAATPVMALGSRNSRIDESNPRNNPSPPFGVRSPDKMIRKTTNNEVISILGCRRKWDVRPFGCVDSKGSRYP
jgi:hypothetical protein